MTGAGVHRARRLDLPGGGRFPVPSHPDPRRRLPRYSKGDPRGVARALCRLARADDGAEGERARRDPGLPPRAGVWLPVGARADRRVCRGAGDSSRRTTRQGRTPCDRGGDVAAAASLLTRAVSLLPNDHPLRGASRRAGEPADDNRRVRACGRDRGRCAEHGKGSRRRPTRDAGADRARVLQDLHRTGGELVGSRSDDARDSGTGGSRGPSRLGTGLAIARRGRGAGRALGSPRRGSGACPRARPAGDRPARATLVGLLAMALLRADAGRGGDRSLHGPARER